MRKRVGLWTDTEDYRKAASDAERIAAIRGGPGMRGYLFKPLPVDTLVVQPQGAFAVFVVYRGGRSGFLKTQTPQIVAVVAAAASLGRLNPKRSFGIPFLHSCHSKR